MLVGSNAMSMNVDCKNSSNIGKSNNSEEPDFIISILKWVPLRCFGYIGARVCIKNIGPEIEDEISIDVKLTLDSDQEILTINYIGSESSPVLHVDLKYKAWKRTHTLTAEVDPPYEGHPTGDIIESNENNNVKYTTFSFFKWNSKYQSVSFQNLLNLCQNIFPTST